ncbi:unnamed protein product [Schistosoma guineensis]|nr:unnamed protein product [Schistosoma guineensis]
MVLVTVNVGEFLIVINTFRWLILRSRFHYLQISEKVIIYNSYEEKLQICLSLRHPSLSQTNLSTIRDKSLKKVRKLRASTISRLKNKTFFR